MKHITNILKAHYYKFTPGEFLPIYSAGVLVNKREFHVYRIKHLIINRRAEWYSFTHYAA